jgi:hypothetical protein
MKTPAPNKAGPLLLAWASGCARVGLLLPAVVVAATPKYDIAPPLKRQASVDLAERLANRKPPEPLAAELRSPFNPADFDKPDPSEAQRAGGAATAGGAQRPGPSGPAPTTTQAPAVAGDRETLEMLAMRIPSSGTIIRDGKPQLVVAGGKRLEVGAKFTVTFNDQDYELELVAIDRTTFTLRYRNEETVRPIKLVR